MTLTASRIAGRSVLFIGNECRYCSIADFAAAARSAQNLGIDTISPKRANGTQRWYATPAQLAAEYQAVHNVGMGYLPFAYCYGPMFGIDFVDQECAVLREMQTAIASVEPTHTGFVCADLETEWNNRPDAAQRFANAMRNKAGLLYLTTWSDPVQQGWSTVIAALRDCVDAWVPQQYSDWLAAQEGEYVDIDAQSIEPAIDLTAEFGANHPLTIVQNPLNRDQATIWFWEYVPAFANRQMVHDIVQLLRQYAGSNAPAAPPQPVALPPSPVQPAPVPLQFYTVQSGDTLSAIANHFGIGSWQILYNRNRAIIEQTARSYGYANSHNGNLIFPGTRLAL